MLAHVDISKPYLSLCGSCDVFIFSLFSYWKWKQNTIPFCFVSSVKNVFSLWKQHLYTPKISRCWLAGRGSVWFPHHSPPLQSPCLHAQPFRALLFLCRKNRYITKCLFKIRVNKSVEWSSQAYLSSLISRTLSARSFLYRSSWACCSAVSLDTRSAIISYSKFIVLSSHFRPFLMDLSAIFP